ncbi:hypothetical protein B0H67DRAFT_594283 [Lasiosphaeris hirsuta]|uniref:Uncharacterized protein n=1 Tax=Lasiosphaeris hirsuta TaxID=260670 RepID=A0AA39ZXX2_9PEZI|nr:hypothetical protein B0H67DRAFT_594283 [Lasiosphaeris hirsuta]
MMHHADFLPQPAASTRWSSISVAPGRVHLLSRHSPSKVQQTFTFGGAQILSRKVPSVQPRIEGPRRSGRRCHGSS